MLTLLASGIVNVLAGSVFAYVGLRFVARGRASPDGALALQAFAAYWTALGIYTALHGVLDAAASLGYAPFDVFLAARYLSLPILVLAVASGTFYFAFLFTGKQGWAWPILAFYAFVLMATTLYVADREPVGVAIMEWRTDLAYAKPYENPFFDALLLALALPPTLGAALYLRLRAHAPDDATRRRITLVGTAILLWSLGAIVARVASDSTLLEWISRPVLGIVVAFVVLAAYRPAAPRADEDARRAALQELDARVAQLV